MAINAIRRRAQASLSANRRSYQSAAPRASTAESVNDRLMPVCLNRSGNVPIAHRLIYHAAKIMRPGRSVLARCRVAGISMRLAQDRQDRTWARHLGEAERRPDGREDRYRAAGAR